MPYYRRAMEKGLPKFVRFALNVWGIRPEGKSDREIAEAGIYPAGYLDLTSEDVKQILRESL